MDRATNEQQGSSPMVSQIRSHISWRAIRAFARRCAVRVPVALLGLGLFGFCGLSLELVFLASPIEWLFELDLFPPARTLHYLAMYSGWTGVLIIGACVVGLWTAAYTSSREDAERRDSVPAGGYVSRERD